MMCPQATLLRRTILVSYRHDLESTRFLPGLLLIKYLAPHGGWVSDWSESFQKASSLVSTMTLAEKTNITAGSGIFMGRCVGNTGSALRVGIPQLW
jgi:hypothetical protein